MSKTDEEKENANHKDGREKKHKNLYTNNMTKHNDKYIHTLQTTM